MLGYQALVNKIDEWKEDFFNDYGTKWPELRDINPRLGRIVSAEMFKNMSTEI